MRVCSAAAGLRSSFMDVGTPPLELRPSDRLVAVLRAAREVDGPRKRLGIVVASALIVVADVVGLWALNRSDSGPALIFEQHAPANPVQTPTPRFGQP